MAQGGDLFSVDACIGGGGVPMKIAQVMLSQGFGGAERYYVDLCRALADRGYSVLAVCRHGSVAHGELAKHAAIAVEPVRVLGAWDPLARRVIRRTVGRFGPDLVHTHMARGAWLGGSAAQQLGLPVVTKLHNYVKLNYYRYVDWFNVTTCSQRDYLLSHGIEPDRIRVIPNFSSFPPKDCVESKAEAQLKIWASFGRFVPKKGFDLLLRAFSRLLNEYPDARLMLAGDGEETERLKALALDLGIERSVEFPGWVTDIRRFLEQADVFVLPSRDEPFGIAVLEAMACGVPIVSTRTKGPLETLGEPYAFMCEVDNIEDLLRAMRNAAASPADRRVRAQSALTRYRENYFEGSVLPRVVDLYADMLEAASVGRSGGNEPSSA